ncbi:MAG: sigma-E processing peptidase SpoIIGA [Butyricicoccus pullicaecorum]|nr:sigma-E processing peptidase SpoIIGA [Butyricicoccus pullicaecorum]
MRVIYVDVLAGVNLAMDYLLLAAAAKLSGAYCTRARLLAGAALGACYAVASCGVPFLTLLPVKAAAGFLMVRLCFGARSAAELVRLAALFYLVSCAAAGGALALGKVSDTTFFAGGGYYIDVPFRVVAAAGAVSWGLTGLLFRGEAKAREACRVHLDFAGHSADFSLLVDTGNDLSDPVSGRPALVLDRRAAARVLPVEAALPLAALRADNAPAVLAALPGTYRTQFQLLPYRAIGKEGGLLLAFRPERAERDGKPWQGLAAISPERVANGFYEGLIGL